MGATERSYKLCLGEEANMCNMRLREKGRKADTREKSKDDGAKRLLPVIIVEMRAYTRKLEGKYVSQS